MEGQNQVVSVNSIEHSGANATSVQVTTAESSKSANAVAAGCDDRESIWRSWREKKNVEVGTKRQSRSREKKVGTQGLVIKRRGCPNPRRLHSRTRHRGLIRQTNRKNEITKVDEEALSKMQGLGLQEKATIPMEMSE